jgi:hypothetical protein
MCLLCVVRHYGPHHAYRHVLNGDYGEGAGGLRQPYEDMVLLWLSVLHACAITSKNVCNAASSCMWLVASFYSFNGFLHLQFSTNAIVYIGDK